ncbi:hypothetical protein DWB85_16695 [Seongchinamella sediminis]|uniref:Uncharacterized protein n=1 Tax=Seongchinamella sediminis TaxID=2283635 RepID=A0A3L7DVS4_9GAMM|nr:hypothetical protein [Seongchinamella sediminis]RLQ20639.1 hypothetical protein DWB85_16695 [Seongchinamella sediminis]
MKKLSTIFASTLLALSLSACDSNDGPMEEAGEKIDEGYGEVVDSVEEAADEVEKKADEMSN